MATRRALHFVFKVGDRSSTIKFFKDVLGMKVLRHEEFTEGCLATCNGPYDGRWSKTMVGYGPENDHFVMELTYNYGVSTYKLGNDFQGLTIKSKDAVENVRKFKWPFTEKDGIYTLEAPGGYKFHLINESDSSSKDPVEKVSLSTSNLDRSIDYWNNLCQMKIYDQQDKMATLGYEDKQCKLELIEISEPLDHAKAYGRIAFSCPSSELPSIEEKMKQNNQKILTPLISLDTPGKATVQVVILADPDGHEICFVGDEAFRELSQFDPKGDVLLTEAMEADKSNEWFAKKGLSKAEEN